VGLFTRAIRPPPDDIVPNPNDPASVPPSTVGPDQLVRPGDPHGVVVEGPDTPASVPPRILPSAWSGWPAEWWPPLWGNQQLADLTDTAWMCLDLNSSVLATMPPYLVDAAPTLSSDWLRNPDPDIYTAWEEFAKQLFWDYQAVGEAFVIATARYATGWPARFHVVPPWTVQVEFGAEGRRRYTIGSEDVSADMLHVRYQSSVDDAHGHGPLEAGAARMVAAQVLTRYGTTLASSGGIPSSVLKHPEELSPEQATLLQQQWVAARMSTLGEPAVLSGGITWEATQLNPKDMALVELVQFNESRIAILLGVPPFLVGLPSGGDPMTYSNVTSVFDFHWRAGLRPKAQAVMSALSEWLLPRGTRVEVNRDAYVQPEPLVRAQTAEILNRIKDDEGNPALSVAEIRASERLTNSTPEDISSGVLR
jgi:HK97 family phage portal protein